MSIVQKQMLHVFKDYIKSETSNQIPDGAMEIYKLISMAIHSALNTQCKEFNVKISRQFKDPEADGIDHAIFGVKNILRSNGWRPYMYTSSRNGIWNWEISCSILQ